MRWLRELHWQIVVASILGITVGLLLNGVEQTWWLQPIDFVGQLFLRGLRFVAVPIVVFSLVGGIGALSDLSKLGRIASRTVLMYLCSTAIAIGLGLFLSEMVLSGQGLPQSVQSNMQSLNGSTVALKMKGAVAPSLWDTLLNIIPINPFKALAEGNMLQVLFFSIALGLGVAQLPTAQRTPIVGLFDGLTQVIIHIIQGLMKLAPLAVFCLLLTVGHSLGTDVIGLLARYVLTVLLGLGLMIFGVYPLIIRSFTSHSIPTFFRSIAPAQLLAFSSSSSSATMPITLECCQDNLQLDKDVSRFVIPLGATINMDGTALYQGVAAAFIAQLSGLDLSLIDHMTIILTATLASIGTAGVPGVGLIMLVVVLESIGLTAAQMTTGLAIIFGVDRLLDMVRTVVNVTGDCTVATVVNTWEPSSEQNP